MSDKPMVSAWKRLLSMLTLSCEALSFSGLSIVKGGQLHLSGHVPFHVIHLFTLS
jgi:hypothetical protein